MNETNRDTIDGRAVLRRQLSASLKEIFRAERKEGVARRDRFGSIHGLWHESVVVVGSWCRVPTM